MKKIVIIFPKDSEAIFNSNSRRTFGGATVQMHLISKAISKTKNYKVFDFIQEYENINFKEKNIQLVTTFKEKDNLITKIKKFTNKITEIKPDILIQHGLSPLTPFLASYCKRHKIKFVFIFASDVESLGRYQNSNKKAHFFRTLLSNSELIITQNKYQKNNLLRLYGKDSTVIYPGMEIENPTRKTKKFILWVSRCDELKKPEVFIELSKQNPNLNFLMICPPSKNKDYYKRIRRTAQEVKNLKFKEFVSFDKIDNYFKQAKIFVNTSDYEGFPNTFLQAIKFGVPILSLNVNPDNFITKYNCGWVCKNNFVILNKKLRESINNKKSYNNIRKNTYKFAKSNVDINKNTKLLMNKIK